MIRTRPQRSDVLADIAVAALTIMAMALWLALGGGCGSISMPWDEGESRPSSGGVHAFSADGKMLLAVGSFENPPSAPLPAATIGPGVSAALLKPLNQGERVIARVDAALGREVADALALGESLRRRRLGQIAGGHREFDAVIIGSVRRFQHVAHSPQDLSRWGPSHSRVQATVELHFTAVDLRNAKIIGSGDVSGVAWADQPSSPTLDRGTPFGSYQFWQTPLGLASRDAIAQAARQIAEMIPTSSPAPVPIRIVGEIDGRRVRLSADALNHAQPGDVMYVCGYAADGLTLHELHDLATRRPLMARIESRGMGRYPSAWLLGAKPANINLRGAALCRQRPVITASR